MQHRRKKQLENTNIVLTQRIYNQLNEYQWVYTGIKINNWINKWRRRKKSALERGPDDNCNKNEKRGHHYQNALVTTHIAKSIDAY